MEILCKTLCAIFFISYGISFGVVVSTSDQCPEIVFQLLITGSCCAILAMILWARSLEDYEDIDDIMDE